MKGALVVVTPNRPTMLIGIASPKAPGAYSVTNPGGEGGPAAARPSFTTHRSPNPSKAKPTGKSKAVSHPPIVAFTMNAPAAIFAGLRAITGTLGVGGWLPVFPETNSSMVPSVGAGCSAAAPWHDGVSEFGSKLPTTTQTLETAN